MKFHKILLGGIRPLYSFRPVPLEFFFSELFLHSRDAHEINLINIMIIIRIHNLQSRLVQVDSKSSFNTLTYSQLKPFRPFYTN